MVLVAYHRALHFHLRARLVGGRAMPHRLQRRRPLAVFSMHEVEKIRQRYARRSQTSLIVMVGAFQRLRGLGRRRCRRAMERRARARTIRAESGAERADRSDTARAEGGP